MDESELRAQIEQLEDEVDTLKTQLRESEAEWERLQEEMETEIETLKSQLSDCKSEARDLQLRLEAETERADDEERQGEEARGDVANLEEKVDCLENKLERVTADYDYRMTKVQMDMAEAVIWWQPNTSLVLDIVDLLEHGLPPIFQKQFKLSQVVDQASCIEFDKKLTPLVWKFVAPVVKKKYRELFSQLKK